MSTATFGFDEQPDQVYRAELNDNGFIIVQVAVPGGEFIDVCGFSVTQTPPPVQETPPPEGG